MSTVSLVSWEWGSHVVFFMVPLGPPGARSMAQALWLQFEYYYYYYYYYYYMQKMNSDHSPILSCKLHNSNNYMCC